MSLAQHVVQIGYRKLIAPVYYKGFASFVINRCLYDERHPLSVLPFVSDHFPVAFSTRSEEGVGGHSGTVEEHN